MTNPHIKSSQIQLPRSTGGHFFDNQLEFGPGLNIICGENGTGKTKLLAFLKANIANPAVVVADDPRPTLSAFSPKRNATKQALAAVTQNIRSQSVRLATLDSQLLNLGMNDATFSAYRSFSEYFVVLVEEQVRNGDKTYLQAIASIRDEFQAVLRRVFPGYTLNATWENQSPNLSVSKNDAVVPLQFLSCGENEVLSLVFNLYGSRDRIGTFLIDEPELHLNWQLEAGFFDFLRWFCSEFGKQVDVATHARVIVQDTIRENRIILKWNGDSVEAQREVDAEIRAAVAGDAIQIINGLTLADSIIFAEDTSHKVTLETLADVLDRSVDVRIENGRTNVEKLFRTLRNEAIHNCFFVIDNDNRPADADLTANRQFVQLSRYCIENYFLDPVLLSGIASAVENVGALILSSISEVNEPAFRFFHRLIVAGIELGHAILNTVDGSKVLKKLAPKLGFRNHYELMKQYITHTNQAGRVQEVFAELAAIL